MERREFLVGAAVFGTLLVGGPFVSARAADGTAAAFAATSENDVLARLFPGLSAQASGAVELAAPYLARPGQAIMVRAALERSSSGPQEARWADIDSATRSSPSGRPVM